MATTVQYTASLCTRKTNYVQRQVGRGVPGVLRFQLQLRRHLLLSGMNLAGGDSTSG